MKFWGIFHSVEVGFCNQKIEIKADSFIAINGILLIVNFKFEQNEFACSGERNLHDKSLSPE